ncbi:bifunctional ADP-dependent NAD(P)H-hydrate dehydratase/NAD(P)H-hydrate epimerase [Vreelandella jeotgali]|uniref:bifunctional ADP-dependent NAD(P)H-hydrate dehydratase/NAD(P)H-hydrate epimerase n=1 Tax=Vreelandella jeotgali TaxID=553386 RepID=UPI00034A344A|nr:bifunctional ADP-dependent NAD(P)H-hydrate dehydratase/NAD(P)H-hydrate epimerase [Halomonas jeotgali]
MTLDALRPLYTARQVGKLDRRTMAAGIEGFALMQRAAFSAWQVFHERWPDARSLSVLCGGGHNGGDGYIIAALAAQAGLSVECLALKPVAELDGDAARASATAEAAGVDLISWHNDARMAGDVVVDAMLGTGLSGEVKGAYGRAIDAVNRAGKPVLSVDIPSGLAADTGAMLGRAVHADATVTFIGDKLGLHTGQAPAHTGEMVFCPLGVNARAFFDIVPRGVLLHEQQLAGALAPRRRTAHKGEMGHVLVLGGAPGMGGAALIASQTAARLGAGRVSLATAPAHVSASLTRCPEVMAHGVRGGADVAELINRSSVIVVGPGIGQGAWGQAMLGAALESRKPLVVDADALNLVASRFTREQRDDWVLTPHPGEAGRLLGISAAEVEADRPAAVEALRQRYGGSVVLKGAGSLVAGSGGLAVCPYGNPGMASGGMGDALAGMLGALAGQFGMQDDTVRTGVLVHALAANMAANDQGERGLLASDLASCARRLINPRSA